MMIRKMIAAFLIQIAALGCIIGVPVREKSLVEKNGEIYELSVNEAYIYESVGFDSDTRYVFEVNCILDKPDSRREYTDFDGNAYLNINEYDGVCSGWCRYRFENQDIGKYVESYFNSYSWEVNQTEEFMKEHNLTAKVKIYGDRLIFEDLYIDGIQIEEYFG